MNSSLYERRHRTENSQGFTLLGTILLVAVCSGLTLTYFAMSSGSIRVATRRESSMRLDATATSAAQLVAQEVWNRYVHANGGAATDLSSFREFLDAGSSVAAVPKGDGDAFGVATDVKSVIAGDAGEGASKFGQLYLVAATARRRDTDVETDLEVSVTMATGDVPSAERTSVRQAFTIGGAEFKGFDYALLTNNVNCIMCHATFDSAGRYYNSDASKLSSFNRVKIGTLSSLQIRAHEAMSDVYGTIHSRGSLMDSEGNPLASLSNTTLQGAELDETGHIVEQQNGSILQDDLTLASGDPLPQNGQLYLNYPTQIPQMTDGELPLAFPAAVPDMNGNKKVDKDEFDLIAKNSTGSLGGSILTVKDGSTFESSIASGSVKPSISGSTNDNLVLMGTPDNPIKIDGKIAVDGDVVLFGTVKGEGAIYASGNVYVVGDLQYADGVDANGNRTFGVGQDGHPNALALAAGGNIITGDHLSIPKWGPYQSNPAPVNGDGTGSYNFTMNEMAIFNRQEWAKTQPTLPGIDGQPVTNPSYVANYTPSYYVLNEGNPVFIMNGANLGAGDQSQLYFDPASGLWKGKELLETYEKPFLQQINATDAAYGSAVIKPLSPQNHWMSIASLQGLRKLAEMFHPVGPMKVDALLYTNNAAFAMMRNLSKYQGRLLLNGGLIAADTGVLLPNGFNLNFDPRPSKFVNLWDLTKPIEMHRAVWRKLNSYSEQQP